MDLNEIINKSIQESAERMISESKQENYEDLNRFPEARQNELLMRYSNILLTNYHEALMKELGR